MACRDQVASEEPAAATELEHEPVPFEHRLEEREQAGCAGGGVPGEALVVDARQVGAVVRFGRQVVHAPILPGRAARRQLRLP